MAHYRMLDRVPSVVITSNRNELKLYQGNLVYLNNGDNFELRFFNPLQEKIGVEIIFNGVKKGDSYLVLNPGQDIILDRFLDEQRKMLFETYVVNGDSQEALDAIQKNGLIKFNFYKEYSYANRNKTEVDINYNFPPKPHRYDHNYYTNTNGSVNTFNLSGASTSTSGVSGISGTSGSSGSSGVSGLYGVSGTKGISSTYSTLSNTAGMGNVTTTSFNSNIYYSNTSTYNSNSRIYSSPGVFTTEFDQSFVSMDMLEETELETGRIEKGDISNQTLRTVNAQFASTSFHTVTYKMLPYSSMDRTIGEVREYCTDCGYRLRKQTWKYCPKCGTKIN